MARILSTRMVFTFWLMLLSLSLPAFAGITEGMSYLSGQVQENGSYSSNLEIATPYQSTAEVLVTFYALNNTPQPASSTALQFLQKETFQGTEYLSRLIVAQAKYGQVDSVLLNQLKSYQNRDGGFGELAGYNSTVLDTVFAVQALASSGQSTSQSAGLAISFLQTKQNQAGYFVLSSNDASIYITALASQVFQKFQYVYAVSDNITRANDYLLTQITADGSAGELFETAVVLATLVPVTANQAIYQPLIDHLQSSQQINGDWADDVFTTALAIRALYIQQTATPIQPDQASLTGVVKDRATDNPLSHVNVTVTTIDGQNILATTDIDGRYLVSNIVPGTASVHFNASGYYPVIATVSLVAGQVLRFDTNMLADPATNLISLSGQVNDADTSLPIDVAVIHILNSAFLVQSDVQGRFELSNIPAGSITLEVTKDGYLTQLFSISSPAGGEVDLGIISLELGSSVGSESRIFGLMTDAVSGKPLRGVLISVSGGDNQSAFTAQDGQFLLNSIMPGDVVVSASLDGYLNATGNAFLVAGASLQFNASLVKELNPALVTLQGKVVDAETQQALTDASVVTGKGQTADTDGAGGFYLSGLEPGTIILKFSAVGYNTVSYSINVAGGGSINLDAIAMVKNLPITGNTPPNISSKGPVHAAAGQIYEYQPNATDPEGTPLIFGLSGNPGGMGINTSTGAIRWIPTTEQLGEQIYTLVVSDTDGAITQQTVIVTVTGNGDPSYVITDVETLNALTVDALMPDNYVLGRHVKGGRSGTWRAVSSQGCGFSYVGTGTDSASITAAANALDFWSMGSGYGSDGIWDLGEALTTVTVLPLIDHAPFPQEGIEYTIWGSDDPDAVFPDGWALATLVTIYSQGWADNTAVCGGGVNIDDYAGLYSFGQDQFRYIRLKADNSISIFDTPEHTTYSTYTDDSGLPGWQSVESEIDGVVGMVCDEIPLADAGENILGKTRDSIIFDGTASQGNIAIYGWDLDGDSEIDLTGASPEYTFTAGFDRDVSLLVVDDKGCVGMDTVHVTIGLDFPEPDLVVATIDTANVSTNLQTLAVSGTVALTIANQGNAPALLPAEVTLFEDRNANGQFDPGVDYVLGTQTMPSGLAKDNELAMDVVVNGISLFRDNPILAMVDSNDLVAEAREDNNLASTADSCSYTPTSLGDFDFIKKWYMPGDVFGPVNVVQLSDDNGDGYIGGNDTPDIIFVNNIGSGRGNLIALSGNTGQVIWKNTSTIVTSYGSTAAGDIDGDGVIEIIISNSDRTKLHAFEHDGTLKWTAETTPRFSSPRDAVALADIDHDGDVEIIHGRRAYDHLGNLLWEGNGDYGGDTYYGTLPIIVDLNNQGDMEIIAGRTAYRSDGSTLWRRTDLPSGGGFTAIGDFNQDETPEIVLVAGGGVYLLDNQGKTIWGPVALPGGGSGGAPTVGDFDGDGEPEIGVAGGRNYVVLETNGSIKWTSGTQDGSSHRTGSSLFDFNLDGKVEVVYADELYLRVYDGSTGTIIKQHRLGSGTTLEYPVIADIDGDGQAEIVMGSNSGFSSRRGLYAFEGKNDNWAPTRAIWNQHSYHINNINDDGTVPQFEQPSWLSHNSYRLNTFAERDPTLLPDITASVLTIHDNGENQPASISVRIGNAGAGDLSSKIGIAFYEGNPANNGALLGVIPIDNLAQGSYQDIELNNIESLSGVADIYVIADYDNRLPECNESNNRVMLPVLPQTSTGQIFVATDKLVYGPDSVVLLQSSVTNVSGVPGEFKTTVFIEGEQGSVVQKYEIHPIGPLAGGVSLSLTELWQTAQYQAGTYALRGVLYNLSGEVINEAISAFDIRHAINGEPLASLRTRTDKPVYNTNDEVQLFNLAQNLAVNKIIADVSLQVTIIGPSGISVFTETLSVGSLAGGTLRDFTSLYVFTQGNEGIYTVTGELFNGAGISLAINQAQFEVQENLKQLLTGEVRVQLPTLDRGQTQTCHDTLLNTGVNELLAQPIRQILINLDSTEVASTSEILIDLSTFTPYSLTRDVTTSNLHVGGYACVLQGKTGDEWITLANDSFVLTEPPIKIQGQLSKGDRGRVLILLDEAAKQCSGFSEISLEATLSTPLTSNATVTAMLYESSGILVDQEMGRLDERAIDLQMGNGGINLILDDIAATHIVASVNALSLLGESYQLVIAVRDAEMTETFDSGLIYTDCSQALAIGDNHGQTRLTNLVRLPAANDPLGPNHTPDLAAQRSSLEILLTEAGWSYTITTNADDFTRELRSGGYVTYLLLSEQVKLEESVQKELREAVYRGEGLVEAGSHDQRQGRIDIALGVKFQGKHSGMQGLSLTDNSVTQLGDVDFQLTDRTLKATVDGAEILGVFINQDKLTAEPAITQYSYGLGRSVYLGFDLAAEIALSTADSLLETLLLDTLGHVHPATLANLTLGTYPLRITLDNLGIATPGQLIVTLSQNVSVLDSGAAALNQQQLIWPFNLAEEKQLTFDAWLKLPAQSHPIFITGLIQSGSAPDWIDQGAMSLELTPEALMTVDSVYMHAAGISDKAYKQVQKYLGWALEDSVEKRWPAALSALLRAADALIVIDTAESKALRIEVAKAIRSVAINMNK